MHTSYRDYIGLADHSLIKKDILLQQHGSVEEFKIFSKELLPTIDSKYWI